MTVLESISWSPFPAKLVTADDFKQVVLNTSEDRHYFRMRWDDENAATYADDPRQ